MKWKPWRRPGSQHPAAERLAELGEAIVQIDATDLPEEDRLPVKVGEAWRHVRGCAECESRVLDVLVSRQAARGGAPEPLVGEYRELALRAGEEWAREARARSESGGPLRPRRLLGAFGLAGVAVVAVLLVLFRPTLGPPSDLSAAFIPPAALQQAVWDASSEGMVLPGGETGSGFSVTYRNGGGAQVPELRHALDEMRAATEEGVDVDQAAWMAAGELAIGRARAARGVILSAISTHPDDERLLILRAVVDYRESRLDDAETHLRAALRQRPMNVVARFNLALLLAEMGDAAGARAELKRIPEGAAPLLDLRVKRLRERLDKASG